MKINVKLELTKAQSRRLDDYAAAVRQQISAMVSTMAIPSELFETGQMRSSLSASVCAERMCLARVQAEREQQRAMWDRALESAIAHCYQRAARQERSIAYLMWRLRGRGN